MYTMVGLIRQDIDPEDHATLDALNGQTEAADGAGRTLADLIFSKMEGGPVSKGIEDEEGESVHSRDAMIGLIG